MGSWQMSMQHYREKAKVKITQRRRPDKSVTIKQGRGVVAHVSGRCAEDKRAARTPGATIRISRAACHRDMATTKRLQNGNRSASGGAERAFPPPTIRLWRPRGRSARHEVCLMVLSLTKCET